MKKIKLGKEHDRKKNKHTRFDKLEINKLKKDKNKVDNIEKLKTYL